MTRTLDKYKTSNTGSYDHEYNGCHYENEESLLQVGFLELCGCGNPDENLQFVCKGLELASKRLDMPPVDYDRLALPLFGNSNSELLFYYFANQCGLMEHGCSVPGWLTEKGHEFIAAVKELYPDVFKT